MSYAFYMKLGWTDEKLLKGCASIVATERKHALGRLHHEKVNILDTINFMGIIVHNEIKRVAS